MYVAAGRLTRPSAANPCEISDFTRNDRPTALAAPHLPSPDRRKPVRSPSIKDGVVLEVPIAPSTNVLVTESETASSSPPGPGRVADEPRRTCGWGSTAGRR